MSYPRRRPSRRSRARRLAGVLGLLVVTGCREQMTIHLENHGTALAFHVYCGDSMLEDAHVAAGGRTSFAPRASSCTLMLDSPATGRSFDVDVVCKAPTCSFSVEFPMGSGVPSATIAHNGSIRVVGDVATVALK